jgi:hypothetical protein
MKPHLQDRLTGLQGCKVIKFAIPGVLEEKAGVSLTV